MALRNRHKKKNSSSLADILQASVPDNALSAMKANSAFVLHDVDMGPDGQTLVPSPGHVLYAGLFTAVDTNSPMAAQTDTGLLPGGFSDKKNPQVGDLVTAINAVPAVIKTLLTRDMLDSDAIIIIPDQATLSNAHEYAILDNAKVDIAFVQPKLDHNGDPNIIVMTSDPFEFRDIYTDIMDNQMSIGEFLAEKDVPWARVVAQQLGYIDDPDDPDGSDNIGDTGDTGNDDSGYDDPPDDAQYRPAPVNQYQPTYNDVPDNVSSNVPDDIPADVPSVPSVPSVDATDAGYHAQPTYVNIPKPGGAPTSAGVYQPQQTAPAQQQQYQPAPAPEPAPQYQATPQYQAAQPSQSAQPAQATDTYVPASAPSPAASIPQDQNDAGAVIDVTTANAARSSVAQSASVSSAASSSHTDVMPAAYRTVEHVINTPLKRNVSVAGFDVAVTSEPFDARFGRSMPFVPFDENRGDNPIGIRVAQYVKAANTELARIHIDGYSRVRDAYFNAVLDAADNIASQLDIHGATAYAQAYRTAAAQREADSARVDLVTQARIKQLEERYSNAKGLVVDAAAAEASRAYDDRYYAAHQARLDTVHEDVANEIENRYDDNLTQLDTIRRDKFEAMMTHAIDDALAKASDMWRKVSADEKHKRDEYAANIEQQVVAASSNPQLMADNAAAQQANAQLAAAQDRLRQMSADMHRAAEQSAKELDRANRKAEADLADLRRRMNNDNESMKAQIRQLSAERDAALQQANSANARADLAKIDIGTASDMAKDAKKSMSHWRLAAIMLIVVTVLLVVAVGYLLFKSGVVSVPTGPSPSSVQQQMQSSASIMLDGLINVG